MIISQHSGEGKANQYYLRGFNLDHGFDFAQTIAGIPGEHADARARAGLRGLELPDPRAGERRAVPQGSVLRGERRLLVGGLGQHQLLQRARPADRHAHRRLVRLRPLPRRRLAARRRRQPARRVRVGARQRPVGQPEQQGQVQRRGPLQPGRLAQRAVADVPGLPEPLALDRPDSAARRRQRRDRPLRVHRGNRRRRDLSATAGVVRLAAVRRQRLDARSPPTCSATASSCFTTSPTS